MIKEGMIVRYSEKWSTPGERKYLFVVKESYPDVERCLITCINSSLSIAPSETVRFEMIEPVGCIHYS